MKDGSADFVKQATSRENGDNGNRIAMDNIFDNVNENLRGNGKRTDVVVGVRVRHLLFSHRSGSCIFNPSPTLVQY